jgi:hypothetical protein
LLNEGHLTIRDFVERLPEVKAQSLGSILDRGFFFVSFLAIRVYFKILKRLRERHLTFRISVEEVLFELSKIERG